MKEEIVEKLLEYVKKTENFALEQLPEGIWMPLFFSPVFICIFIFATSALIKITIAPKYFLIELIRKIAN